MRNGFPRDDRLRMHVAPSSQKPVRRHVALRALIWAASEDVPFNSRRSFRGSRLGSYCALQFDGLIPIPTWTLRSDYPPDSIQRFVIFYGVLFGRTHPWDVGSAVCCFERSSLPEHQGKRVVVMRLLRSLKHNPVRLMQPQSWPSESCPQEGELLKVIRGRKVRPWSQNVGALKEKGSSKGVALDID